MKRNKVVISKFSVPMSGYKYNVKIITSVDRGKTWFYSGIGKFCKNLKEVLMARQEFKRVYG